jgi:hypothetical protein
MCKAEVVRQPRWCLRRTHAIGDTKHKVEAELTKAIQNTAKHNAIVISASLILVGYTVSSSSSAFVTSVSVVFSSFDVATSFDNDARESACSCATALSLMVAGSTATAAFSDITATPLGASVDCAESSFDDLLDGRGVASSGTPIVRSFVVGGKRECLRVSDADNGFMARYLWFR